MVVREYVWYNIRCNSRQLKDKPDIGIGKEADTGVSESHVRLFCLMWQRSIK